VPVPASRPELVRSILESPAENVLVQVRAQGFVAGDLEALRGIVLKAFPPRRHEPQS
jgi:rhamnulokinase